MLWVVAALILLIGTDVPADLARPVGILRAGDRIVCVVISRWARTLNRHHGLEVCLRRVGSHTVNVASRLEESGIPGWVHISETTRMMMVTDGLDFESCGRMTFQGVGTITPTS